MEVVVADGLKDQAKRVATIGDFIREQREHSQVSMRQLAQRAGVSNPYLSQIERGLRKPSAEILQQIAKGLRVSAEQLYLHAGILESRPGSADVVAAILADNSLSEQHKQTLIQVYESFCREHQSANPTEPSDYASEQDALPAPPVSAAPLSTTSAP